MILQPTMWIAECRSNKLIYGYKLSLRNPTTRLADCKLWKSKNKKLSKFIPRNFLSRFCVETSTIDLFEIYDLNSFHCWIQSFKYFIFSMFFHHFRFMNFTSTKYFTTNVHLVHRFSYSQVNYW